MRAPAPCCLQAPLHYSNVMLVDPVSKKPVRTALRYLPDGTCVRIGLGPDASDQIIPIPRPPPDDSKFDLCGPKDTPKDEACRVTYDPSAPLPFKMLARPSGLPLPANEEASTRSSPSAAPSRLERGSELEGPWAAPPLVPPTSRLQLRRKTLAQHGAAAQRAKCSIALLGLKLSVPG